MTFHLLFASKHAAEGGGGGKMLLLLAKDLLKDRL
jgi:hypothetical protein